nr:YetF domain-containing protein [Alkaliphilus sp. B6464]
MNIPVNTLNYIPFEIIVDGKIIKHNLKELNLNEEWPTTKLKQNNIANIEDVFYAEVQSDGTLFIDRN